MDYTRINFLCQRNFIEMRPVALGMKMRTRISKRFSILRNVNTNNNLKKNPVHGMGDRGQEFSVLHSVQTSYGAHS
jgi:hypothetical protein